MRLWHLAACVGSLALLIAGTTDCSGCGAPCSQATSTLLHTNGFTIVSATSSCGNAWSPGPGAHDLIAGPLAKGADCTFDVALDDGELLSFDVPFTRDGQVCCCGKCNTVEVADFTTITISAPAGYVPDAGSD